MFEEYRAPVVLEPPQYEDDWGARDAIDFNVEGASAKVRFREFFRNFRQDNVYIYREALQRQWNRKEFFLEVDLAHLNEFDEVLFNNLQVPIVKKMNCNILLINSKSSGQTRRDDVIV
jgi:hypothetical protein